MRTALLAATLLGNVAEVSSTPITFGISSGAITDPIAKASASQASGAAPRKRNAERRRGGGAGDGSRWSSSSMVPSPGGGVSGPPALGVDLRQRCWA